jgi:hypothetical protein
MPPSPPPTASISAPTAPRHPAAAPNPERRESAPDSKGPDAGELKNSTDWTFYKITYPGTGYTSRASVVSDILERLPNLPDWACEKLTEKPTDAQLMYDDAKFHLDGTGYVTNSCMVMHVQYRRQCVVLIMMTVQHMLEAIKERERFEEYKEARRGKRERELEKEKIGDGDDVNSKEKREGEKIELTL